MAVTEQTPYEEYIANGVSTRFPLGFMCKDSKHLIVKVDDQETLPGEWYLDQQDVVFYTAPKAESIVSIKRNTPLARTTKYSLYDNSFPPQAINDDMDFVWLKMQELLVEKNLLEIKASKDDDFLKEFLLQVITDAGLQMDQLRELFNSKNYAYDQLIATLKNAINTAAAAGAGANGWIPELIVLPNGRNQNEKNEESLNLLDFLTTQEYASYRNDYKSVDIKNAFDRAVFAADYLNKKLFAFGSFYTVSELFLYCNSDLSCATIEYDKNSGTCLTIANTNLGTLSRKQIFAPRIINLKKANADNWGITTATGIKTVNLNACDLYIPYILNFAIGLHEYAVADKGNCYSTITLGQLQNNKVNSLFSTDGSNAWVNENKHLGGRLGYASSEGIGVSGTRQIKFEACKNVVNNNLFIGTSLEGDVPEYTVENSGTYNSLIFCRWESTAPRILYKKDTKAGTLTNTASQATRNMVQGGYQVDLIQVIREGSGGAFLNRRLGSNTDSQSMSSSVGNRLQNTSSNASPVVSIFNSTADLDNAPTSEYTLQLASQLIQGKLSTDAFARIKLDFTNGRIYLGNGTVDNMNYLYGASGSIYASNNFSPITEANLSVGTAANTWAATYSKKYMYSATVGDFFGAGSPEGSLAAGIGSTYRRSDGSTGTCFYIKETGTGNTGWIAK